MLLQFKITTDDKKTCLGPLLGLDQFFLQVRQVGQAAHKKARVYHAHRGELRTCFPGGTCARFPPIVATILTRNEGLYS